MRASTCVLFQAEKLRYDYKRTWVTDLFRLAFGEPPSPEGEGFPKLRLFPNSANITVNEYKTSPLLGGMHGHVKTPRCHRRPPERGQIDVF